MSQANNVLDTEMKLVVQLDIIGRVTRRHVLAQDLLLDGVHDGVQGDVSCRSADHQATVVDAKDQHGCQDDDKYELAEM